MLLDKSSKILSLLLSVILLSSLGFETINAVSPLFDFKFGRNGGDGTSGSLDGEFDTPFDAAVASNGNIYVLDNGNLRIQIFDSSGIFIRQLGTAGIGNFQGAGAANQFSNPVGITIDDDDNIWIT